jgi:hypothetical protein
VNVPNLGLVDFANPWLGSAHTRRQHWLIFAVFWDWHGP